MAEVTEVENSPWEVIIDFFIGMIDIEVFYSFYGRPDGNVIESTGLAALNAGV